MDVELPLPEFDALERVKLPPKPRYRVNVRAEVEYEDDVEFQTDGRPDEYLDDEENANAITEEVVHWSKESTWGPDIKFGNIEVTFDDGISWQQWEEPDEPEPAAW